MDVDTKIISMYENIGYLGMYGSDVLITILIIGFVLGIVSFASYKAIITELKFNWNLNKCSPIVMPFVGIIMPVPGQTAAETTFENFNYCIQQDMTAVFGIIMMPLEFILYLIIVFLDSVLEMIMAIIELLNWLKNQLSEIFQQIYNKIINFIIPVIEIAVKMRDMLGKMNGIITTALFTILNIYNLTVSGVVNIINILIFLIILLIVVLLAMFAAAILLYSIPFGAIIAFPLQLSAMVIVLAIAVPVLRICLIMQAAIMDIFKESTSSPPKNPF
jgi:hypothetical protein